MNSITYETCKYFYGTLLRGEEPQIEDNNPIFSSKEFYAFGDAMSYMKYKNIAIDIDRAEFKKWYEFALADKKVSELKTTEEKEAAFDLYCLRAKAASSWDSTAENVNSLIDLTDLRTLAKKVNHKYCEYQKSKELGSHHMTYEDLKSMDITVEKMYEFWDVIKLDQKATEYVLTRISNDLEAQGIQIDEIMNILNAQTVKKDDSTEKTLEYATFFTQHAAHTIHLYCQLQASNMQMEQQQKEILKSFDKVCEIFDLRINVSDFAFKTYDEIHNSLIRNKVPQSIAERVDLIKRVTAEVKEHSEELSQSLARCRENKINYSNMSREFTALTKKIKNHYNVELNKLNKATHLFQGFCLASTVFSAISAPIPVVGPFLAAASSLASAGSQMKLGSIDKKRLDVINKANAFLEQQNQTGQLLGYLEQNNLQMLVTFQKEKRAELEFFKANRDYILPSDYKTGIDNYITDMNVIKDGYILEKTTIEADIEKKQKEIDETTGANTKWVRDNKWNFDVVKLNKKKTETANQLLPKYAEKTALEKKIKACDENIASCDKSIEVAITEKQKIECVAPLNDYQEKAMKEVPQLDTAIKNWGDTCHKNVQFKQNQALESFLIRKPVYDALSPLFKSLQFIGDHNENNVLSILSKMPDFLNIVSDIESININVVTLKAFWDQVELTKNDLKTEDLNLVFEKIGIIAVIAGCVVPVISGIGALVNIGISVYKIATPQKDRSLEIIHGMLNEVINAQKSMLAFMFKNLSEQNNAIIQELKESVDTILANIRAGNDTILLKMDRTALSNYIHIVNNLRYPMHDGLINIPLIEQIRKLDNYLDCAKDPTNNGISRITIASDLLSVANIPDHHTGYLFHTLNQNVNLSNLVLFEKILDLVMNVKIDQNFTQLEKEGVVAFIDKVLTEICHFNTLLDNVWFAVDKAIVAKNQLIARINELRENKKAVRSNFLKELSLEFSPSTVDKWKQERTRLSAYSKVVISAIANSKHYELVNTIIPRQDYVSLKDLANGNRKRRKEEESWYTPLEDLGKGILSLHEISLITGVPKGPLKGVERITFYDFFHVNVGAEYWSLFHNLLNFANPSGSLGIATTVTNAVHDHFRSFSDGRSLVEFNHSVEWGSQGRVSYELSTTENSELAVEDIKNIPVMPAGYLQNVEKAITGHLEKIKNPGLDSVLCSKNPDYVPLRFPKEFVDLLNQQISRQREVLETYEGGTVTLGSYDFRNVKDRYELTVQYYIDCEGKKLKEHLYNEIVIATFDALTLMAFNYFSTSENKDVAADYLNVNEFLIQAMYGSTLPGAGSYRLKNLNMVVPVERKFKGLYQLLKESKKACTISYNQENNTDDSSYSGTMSQLVVRHKQGFLEGEAFMHKKMREFMDDKVYQDYEKLYYQTVAMLHFKNPHKQPGEIQKLIRERLRLYAPEEVSYFFIESKMKDFTLFTDDLMRLRVEFKSNEIKLKLDNARTRLEDWREQLTKA